MRAGHLSKRFLHAFIQFFRPKVFFRKEIEVYAHSMADLERKRCPAGEIEFLLESAEGGQERPPLFIQRFEVHRHLKNALSVPGLRRIRVTRASAIFCPTVQEAAFV